MKVVLQVVDEACVKVDNRIIGEIKQGYLLLVGIFETDTEDDVIKMANKISKLRIFQDENNKTNLSLNDVNGSVLSVSQFTLCADTRKGNRPSFVNSANREKAISLYNLFNKEIKNHGFNVACGEFGADMKVILTNNGPFTLVLDSVQL